MMQNLQTRHFLLVLAGIAIVLLIATALLTVKDSAQIDLQHNTTSTEECFVDTDCDVGLKCEEVTTCPPCSEESVDFPNNCQCSTQNTCIPF